MSEVVLRCMCIKLGLETFHDTVEVIHQTFSQWMIHLINTVLTILHRLTLLVYILCTCACRP